MASIFHLWPLVIWIPKSRVKETSYAVADGVLSRQNGALRALSWGTTNARDFFFKTCLHKVVFPDIKPWKSIIRKSPQQNYKSSLCSDIWRSERWTSVGCFSVLLNEALKRWKFPVLSVRMVAVPYCCSNTTFINSIKLKIEKLSEWIDVHNVRHQFKTISLK